MRVAQTSMRMGGLRLPGRREHGAVGVVQGVLVQLAGRLVDLAVDAVL